MYHWVSLSIGIYLRKHTHIQTPFSYRLDSTTPQSQSYQIHDHSGKSLIWCTSAARREPKFSTPVSVKKSLD